ncbi:hypothetical protein FQN57_005097 [Myotisia sp. PD_48]|nr:hypothetical protein FQN57_005097 [Myotisia sp. PD_48]
MLSDIQVFVRWKEQTIFAGEDVECVITFKNVAQEDTGKDTVGTPKHYRGGSRPINGVTAGANYSPAKSLNPFSFNNGSRRPHSSGHRPRQATHRSSASISTPPSFSQSFPPTSAPLVSNGVPQAPGHTHKRSVSIISLDTDLLSSDRKSVSSPYSPRPGRAHVRSASFQVPPRRHDSFADDISPRSQIQKLPPGDSQSSLSLPNLQDDQGSFRFPNNSLAGGRSPGRRSPASGRLASDFKFPPAPGSSSDNSNPPARPLTGGQPSPNILPRDSSSNDMKATTAGDQTGFLAATKLASTSGVAGSTRSSTEFYSISNHSTETLESEYRSMPLHRSFPVRHRRHQSSLEPSRNGRHLDSQSLLMGYAQVNASFTVDGSLINQSIFEEVKRRGVVGHQVERKHTPQQDKPRGSGFWGNLGFNNIGDSITGLLSSGELNGLREMRGVSSSQSIPLLSTPQSLLFVDLRLSPGEEKSFSFLFKLPRGLPGSHKGRAMKISYNLVIGTQRAANVKDQRMHKINVPFRVLSGVDAQGAVLGHDLMRPYVLLRDEAQVQKLDSPVPQPSKQKSISAKTWSSAPQFLSVVDALLDQRTRRDSIQTPATPGGFHFNNETPVPFSSKDAIDLAILRSNHAASSDRSPNRFEISRNGRRVAVIVLNRPSHRLGETVVAAVDFSNAALPCYALRGSLETYEKVSPTIALRSAASITRATRKVHASCSENTLFATRVAFTPSIPVPAAPTLITSGVNLEWQLRFEFVTSSLSDAMENLGATGIGLLDTLERDVRGSILTASEHLTCESFEVCIPITVYGGMVQELGSEDVPGIPI